KIIPVDYANTGDLQENMVLSGGINQMYQIKHQIKLEPETLVSNYMSYTALYKKYGSNIYGMTGTLGSKPFRKFMEEQYNLSSYIIPPYKSLKIKPPNNPKYLCKEFPPLIL